MSIAPRTLGKTGIRVSALGFGCMRLPLTGDRNPEDIDEPQAIAMIRHAVDSGVNYIDTAWPYHGNNFPQSGKSETLVARALADGYRDRVHLATKLPPWNVETRADMDRLLDEQLKRLGTNRIDLYLAHNINGNNWEKLRDLGLFEFFDGAKKDGRILHAAFSFHDNYSLFDEVVGAYDWEMAQIQYNYLDVDYQAGRRGLLEAAKRNIGVVIMEPLRGGFLVQNIPAAFQERFKERHPDWSMVDWSFRWLWDQPEVGVVLSGMSDMTQLDENLAIVGRAENKDFTAGDKALLAEVRQYFQERLKVNCTGCDYCLPCPQGVAISRNFSVYNELGFADHPAQAERAHVFYRMTLKESERAEWCVGCGVCEDRCPQHIGIAKVMSEVAATLGEKK